MNNIRILLLCIFTLFLSNIVYGVSIGVSPGTVNFDNLLREGYAERTIRITTNSEEAIAAHYELEGDIAEWVRFEPNSTNFEISINDPHELKIIIEPSNDARSDSYSGLINFVTDRFASTGSRAGGLVKAAVTLRLGATISDEETRACRAGGFGFGDIEIGYPMELTYRINNDGNVRIKPIVSFEIWDQFQENVLYTSDLNSPEILPTVQQIVTEQISIPSLGTGQYWADIAIDECGSTSKVNFDIVEKGGIIDKGELIEIVNKPWAYVLEPVEIIARFKNTGKRTVSAKFVGDVKLDDKIVEVIDTAEIDIGVGEVTNIQHFFTPVSPGRYVVTGRIYYNKKITFEKGGIINVSPQEEKSETNYLLLLIYLIIIITIIFLIRKIRKERKKRRF